MCGLAGAITVILLAAFYNSTHALENGVTLPGLQLTDNRRDSILPALIIVAAGMLTVELIRLWLRDRGNFFHIHPHLKKGRYGAFLGEALGNWILYLILLGLTVLFFRTANEYGYANQNEYYQIWFRFIELAWVGYTISSRWVNNSTVSTEPTILGWLVCLACYPPFQRILGVYYAAPSERDILQFSNQWIVTVFAFMMLFSYFVYMAATLWFGARFSNLTNRGIIRKGPYALIRHPAYASKNFSRCILYG